MKNPDKTYMVLDMALVGLESFFENESLKVLQDVDSDLQDVIQKAVRVQAYLEARLYDMQEHDAAVKYSNKTIAKVRKALGYTYARQDLSF